MRITKKVLEAQVVEFNSVNRTQVELDEAHCYGGYCLATDNGSHHITERMSGREMYQYLDGMIARSLYPWNSIFIEEAVAKAIAENTDPFTTDADIRFFETEKWQGGRNG